MQIAIRDGMKSANCRLEPKGQIVIRKEETNRTQGGSIMQAVTLGKDIIKALASELYDVVCQDIQQNRSQEANKQMSGKHRRKSA